MPLLLAPFHSFRDTLTEGVYDPGILKCVFMAGGTGSGKSFVAADLFGIDQRFKASFSSFGLKVVNSDAAFEHLLAKNGINPKDLHDIEKNNPELWNQLTGKNSVRTRAKNLTDAQKTLYMQGRLGLIIDGTGDDVQKIQRQRNEAIAMGYDTLMVFVNTRLETSLARNAARARQLPDSIVKEIWTAAQRHIDSYSDIFGNDFLVVQNDAKHGTDPEMVHVIHKWIGQFIRRPIQNPLGREWMQAALRFAQL